MSEIKNGRLGLYGDEYLKRNHMMILGFKGLNRQNTVFCVTYVRSQHNAHELAVTETTMASPAVEHRGT